MIIDHGLPITWFSICSAHQSPVVGCPRCNVGHWGYDVKHVGDWIHDERGVILMWECDPDCPHPDHGEGDADG